MTGAKIICVANRKGGVGKTTLLLCLAKTLTAEYGKRVCVIDTDAQGSATASLVPDAESLLAHLFLEETLEHASLTRRTPLDTVRREQVNRIINRPDVPLSLVPCSPNLWKLEDRMRSGKVLQPNPSRRVQATFTKLLQLLEPHYDYVLIDTPPGRGLLSDIVTRSADLILVPSNPTKLSVWGLDIFVDELRKLKALSKARLVWTLYLDNQNWRDFAIAYEKASELLPLERTADSTDHFKRLAGIERGAVDHDPKMFRETFGEQGAQILSELAQRVITATEKADIR